MDTDVAAVGSLLSRMTNEKAANDIKFSPTQVNAVMEVLLPRIATGMPGLPDGIKCDIQKDEAGWTLRITRPA